MLRMSVLQSYKDAISIHRSIDTYTHLLSVPALSRSSAFMNTRSAKFSM